jgi:hypothetical protein
MSLSLTTVLHRFIAWCAEPLFEWEIGAITLRGVDFRAREDREGDRHQAEGKMISNPAIWIIAFILLFVWIVLERGAVGFGLVNLGILALYLLLAYCGIPVVNG